MIDSGSRRKSVRRKNISCVLWLSPSAHTHRYIDFSKHVDSLPGVNEGDVLRRRDDHRAVDEYELPQAELNVTGPGRHVDDEHVQIASTVRAPVDFE